MSIDIPVTPQEAINQLYDAIQDLIMSLSSESLPDGDTVSSQTISRLRAEISRDTRYEETIETSEVFPGDSHPFATPSCSNEIRAHILPGHVESIEEHHSNDINNNVCSLAPKIGGHVEVFWPDNNAYYFGTVTENNNDGKNISLYDVTDVETFDFSNKV